jgi:folate-binding protein YgfZ
VLESTDGTLLVVPGALGVDVAAWLDARIFMEDVQAADVTAQFSVWGGAVAFGDLAWIDPWPTVVPGGITYGDPVIPGWAWVETLLPAGEQPNVDVLGADLVDPLRIVAGRPSMAEVDDRSLPHELDWLRTAVHVSKGCYPGQETVSKIHNVGHPPRRLVRLQLDGSDSVFVEASDPVWAGGDLVGRVTTAGNHFEDGPVALAVIKRNVDVTALLTVVHDDHPVRRRRQHCTGHHRDLAATKSPKRGACIGHVRVPREHRRQRHSLARQTVVVMTGPATHALRHRQIKQGAHQKGSR